MNSLLLALGDSATLARRNLIKVKRVPDLLVASAVAPVMFVLLFAFVFGRAIEVPGVSYRDFLIPGIFVQTVMTGAIITGTGLAEDLQRGFMDRLRSLPVSNAALLVGRTTSDVVNNAVVVVVMSLTGLLVGWRIHSSPLEAVAGFALLLLFAYACSWVLAVVGLTIRSAEVVSNVGYMVIFPITFIANTFVNTEKLPAPLDVIAEWNPISAITQAVRELFGNTSSLPAPEVWPLRHAVPAALAWIAIMLLVFVPLAVRQYRRAVRR